MAPEQLHDIADDGGQAAIDACLAALHGGGLVVIPTETVYGVGSLPGHGRSLHELKASVERPFSLVVDRVERLAEQLLPLGRLARRLAERCWPGPLTQVLPGRQGGTVGVRIPDHRWTLRLLAALGKPLLLSSANLPGEPAPTSLEQLSARLRAAADVLVDGGEIPDGRASTVLAPGLAGLRLLREGGLDREQLARVGPGRVAVICTGNTCRSPMARALLRAALADLGHQDPRLMLPEVLSAGLMADAGHPASAGAQAALDSRSLDIGGHASRPVDGNLLSRCDVLLGMTRAQVATLRGLASEGQTVALFDPDGEEVPDPFGGPTSVYEACAAHLQRVAAPRARSLLPAGDSP